MSTMHAAGVARSRPRVAVTPADHVYVDRVVDPTQVDLVAPPADALVAWLAGRTEPVDVLHLHLGLVLIDDLTSVQAAARALRLPVVVTLHHHPDPGDRGRGLGELCREAAAVVVHDAADAGVVRQRWQVEAYVQPHPHVAGLAEIEAAAARVRHPPWRVGIASSAAEDHRAARTALVRAQRDRDDVVVSEGMAVDDPGHVAAVRWMQEQDAIVLAGPTARRAWVELARDLGVAVVAPTAAAVVEQGVVATYSTHGQIPLEEEMARAIIRVCDRLPAQPADAGERLEECNRVREAHTALYRAVTAAAGTSTTDEEHHDAQQQRTW